MSWTAPTGTLTGYDVHYTSAAVGTVANSAAVQTGAASAGWVAVSRGTEASPPTASQIISGLSNNTAYRVRVRAKNSAGAGAWAFQTGTPSASTTVWSATLTPGAYSAGQGGFGCISKSDCDSRLSDNSFTISGTSYHLVTVADSNSNQLTVQFSQTPQGTPLANLKFCVGTTAFDISGVVPTVVWPVTLTWSAGTPVSLSIGTSCTQQTTPPATAPGAPTGLGVTPGNARLDLSWTAPATGGAVSDYDVHYTSNSTVSATAAVQTVSAAAGWLAVSRSGTTATQAITGLTNNTAYRVRVRARNSAGSSSWVTGSGTPVAAAQQSVPRNVSVSAGDGKLTLSWQAPSSWASTTARGYRVEWKLSTAAVWARVRTGGSLATIGATATSFEFTGQQQDATANSFTVSNGTAYNLRIRASSTVSGVVTPSTWVSVSGTPQAAAQTTVTLSASPNPATEGESVTVTATLSAAAAGAVSIPVTVSTDPPNTAEPADVGALTSISIASGQTTGTGTITTAQDAGRNDETFTVSLGTPLPSGLTAGSPSSVQVTIRDDEGDRPPATVTLSVGPYRSVSEGSNFFVTATLSERVPGGVKIPVTLTNHTAEEDDYGYRHSGGGNIHVGGLSTEGFLWFRTNQDADGENEEFTVSIDTDGLPASVTAGSPSSVRIRINDDEASKELSVWLSVSPNPVPEGGTVTVTASLEILGSPTVWQSDVIVPLRVYGMTSEAGDHGTLHSVTIPRYRTSGTATIATRRDGDRDDDRFVVELGRLPAHLARGRCSAVLVTISEGGLARLDPCTGRSFDAGLGRLGLRQ